MEKGVKEKAERMGHKNPPTEVGPAVGGLLRDFVRDEVAWVAVGLACFSTLWSFTW